MFDMDETLGLISVKRELDKNERSEYNLIIMATNLPKIIFQGKHFNYFIVLGGAMVFESIHMIVLYPYVT
jgi:hypothetical protein